MLAQVAFGGNIKKNIVKIPKGNVMMRAAF